MQRDRLQELGRALPEKYTISAYVINSNNGIPIGTPCFIPLLGKNITPIILKNNNGTIYKMPKWKHGSGEMSAMSHEIINAPISSRQRSGHPVELTRTEEPRHVDEDRPSICRHPDGSRSYRISSRSSKPTKAVPWGAPFSDRQGHSEPEEPIIREKLPGNLIYKIDDRGMSTPVIQDAKKTYHDNAKKGAKKQRISKKIIKEKEEEFSITVNELRSMKTISEVNKYLRDNIKLFRIYIPFGSTEFDGGMNTFAHTVRPADVCYSKKIPMIYDSVKYFDHYTEFLSLCKDNSKHLATEIVSLLEKYKFINYTAPDLDSSNLDSKLQMVMALFKNINHEYKHAIITHETAWNNLRTPFFDTISISFYRIEDIMPVFDYKKLNGIGLELTFLSSDPDYKVDSQMITIRYLFSKYRENVLIVDGEEVNSRLKGVDIIDPLYQVHQFLNNGRVIRNLVNVT